VHPVSPSDQNLEIVTSRTAIKYRGLRFDPVGRFGSRYG
jgi:hypothetical protein